MMLNILMLIEMNINTFEDYVYDKIAFSNYDFSIFEY